MIIFEKVDPRHLWYTIGYIVADGNLSKDGRHVNIVSKDLDHLLKIKDALGINTPIGMGSNGKSKAKIYGRLQFSDVKFYRYLQNLGITPCKSLTIKEVRLDMLYFSDFIRGLIDGDGCIRSWIHTTNNHIQWSITIISASSIFITWLKPVIEKTYKIKTVLQMEHKARKNPIYRIKLGKLASQELIKNIYYKDCLNLDRKRAVAEQCLLDAPKMLNYNSVICPGGEIG